MAQGSLMRLYVRENPGEISQWGEREIPSTAAWTSSFSGSRPQDPSAGVEASVSAETNAAVYNSSAHDLFANAACTTTGRACH